MSWFDIVMDSLNYGVNPFIVLMALSILRCGEYYFLKEYKNETRDEGTDSIDSQNESSTEELF